jgi:hypothetical protein
MHELLGSSNEYAVELLSVSRRQSTSDELIGKRNQFGFGSRVQRFEQKRHGSHENSTQRATERVRHHISRAITDRVQQFMKALRSGRRLQSASVLVAYETLSRSERRLRGVTPVCQRLLKNLVKTEVAPLSVWPFGEVFCQRIACSCS